MSAQIQVILGPDRGRIFPIDPGTTIAIGRSHSTDTRLIDGAVSRLHCELEFDGKRGILLNVSTKGTMVNGAQIEQQQELRHGDVIRIGGTEMRFALTVLAEAETLVQPTSPPEG